VKNYGNVVIPGGVLSGSTDTTLMNTIRMLSYIRFCVERVGIKEYEVWVKGDDTVLFVKPSDVSIIVESIE
jgi:hypothetical protein